MGLVGLARVGLVGLRLKKLIKEIKFRFLVNWVIFLCMGWVCVACGSWSCVVLAFYPFYGISAV